VRDFVRCEVEVDDAVDGVRAAIDDGREFGAAGFEGWFVGVFSEGEAGFPFHAFVDPLAEDFDVGGWEAVAFWGHAVAFVVREEDFDEEAVVGFSGFDDGSVFGAFEERFEGVHGEAGLAVVLHVAFGTMSAEDGDDLVCEVDFGTGE
jgi:hypothetical protein